MMHPGINQCDLTCKYLNWRAEEESLITSEASRSARLAFCSPSAAITLARASRAASASAAMALCSWTGKRTSLLQEKYQWLKMLLLVQAWKYVHFYPFHLDAPRLCCLVKSSLGKENIDSKALLTYEEISAMKYTCMEEEILSRSLKISCNVLVPKIFLNVVWARRRVEWWAFSTLATDTVALLTR